ncbi:hypothetical protein LSAT2_018661 [Lamellibrachia satsuma]|nr:hypothetical protein LSAT2_018661 [Lamellibrachia satsuma]
MKHLTLCCLPCSPTSKRDAGQYRRETGGCADDDTELSRTRRRPSLRRPGQYCVQHVIRRTPRPVIDSPVGVIRNALHANSSSVDGVHRRRLEETGIS